MAVPAALAPYVTSLEGYGAAAGSPALHRGLPSTELTLVLTLDEPLDIEWADVEGSRAKRWSTVSGLHAAPALIHQVGPQRGVQVQLTTAGATALLGVPAGALAGEILTIEEAGAGLADLPERVHGLPTDDATRVVTAALLDALARHGGRRPQAEVGRALAGLTRGASVTDVAHEVGYSRRRLSTLVREECGLAPKEYQRVARFARSRRVIGRRPLVEVAAVCGYADQAHLAREWSALAGCPPTTWLREEFPFLQDVEGPDPAA